MPTDAANDPFAKQRDAMVREQIIGRGVRDPRVLKAMREVPRHRFVSESLRERAYDDSPLSIGKGQTISQPYMVAMMTELLELEGDESVLEIGTGSGYQAAVLAKLARKVTTLERIEALAKAAAGALRGLGYGNVEVRVADGTLGYSDGAPYDAIIVTAGGPEIPRELLEQLAVGGRLVIPVGGREFQRIVRVRREASGFTREENIQCAFVPLIGEEGW